MFAVEVSDQIMIAHSFRGEIFGPAQALHGATFVVRAAFLAERLDEHGIVVDIGRAHEQLKATLAPLAFRNLDELAAAARAGKLGRDGRDLRAIRVTVAESPSARASYEAPLW